MDSMSKQVKVCIIGAGVSGLGAAQKLVNAGVRDIVILEAQDRVGGRVHTVPHGNHLLEFGAHWIHGEEGNVVHEWAVENGLVEDGMSLTQTGIGETMFVRPNGELVPQKVVDDFQLISSRIQEAKEELASYPKSFGDFFMERFRKENQFGKLGEELADWQGRFQNCIDGTDSWFETSSKGHTIYRECPGNPVVNWKEGGYRNLIDYLKKDLTSSQLRLQTPVKCVDWNVDLPDGKRGCVVQLESGDVIQATHVVFTPSLAVLKACAKQLFIPPLPSDKLKAIEGLGIGCVNKIYLMFPNQWWPEGCDGFSLLHDLDDLPLSITKENWECGLLGFYEVVNQPNMICCWITGEAARQMEMAGEEEVSSRCVALLRKYLSSRFNIPDVLWCKRSSWGSNPWTRGSYSFRSLKTEALDVYAADLAKPLVDPATERPLVCFAGEATHDHYYSTVHGALETGWREADRLLKVFQRTQELMSSTQGSLSISRSLSRAKIDQYQVIIIGCGAAGIGAARELTSRGINSVLILEGSDRIGGRIKTIKTGPSHHVDLGAQWIHGEVGNAVHKFAISRGLLYDFVSTDGEGDFFTEDGQLILSNVAEEVMTVMEEADIEMQGMSNASDQLSVGEFFKKKFYKYLDSCRDDTADVRRLKEALFEWYVRWQRVDNACNDLQALSAHCWGRYIFCEGKENMNPKDGFSNIINALLKETNADLVFNSEVNSVYYAEDVKVLGNRLFRPDGVTSPVIVKCKDGKEYGCEYVVVTPSIGYLKTHLEMFSPALPENLQKAVISTGYGTIDKIFLEFDEPFWSDDCQGIHLVWKDQIPIYERNLSVDSKEMKTLWFQGINGFDVVGHQKAMLCGWIGGVEAEYMESLPVAEVGKVCVDLLQQFMGTKDIPYPKKVYRSQWASNELTCGSYSYHTVPCECRTGERSGDALNVPVYASTNSGEKIPVLVLAGEANSVAYYSTVHGALQNGMSQVLPYVNASSRFGAIWSNIKSKI